MSQHDEAARRDAFEDDVRTALFRPTGELRRLQFRLMGFALGVALIVLLAPTWLISERSSRQTIDIYSGISLFGLLPAKDSPMGALGTVLMFGYLLLALTQLVLPPEYKSALASCIAGLVVTFTIVVNQPEAQSEAIETNWTGAPLVALLIWLLLIITCGTARATTQSN
ncbi:hypothetical protein [Kribbella catacumbae]|uniref:hypothetical protein n=1 Tax=Kribbella catacumbae TaxID=460086 RepID=UPI000369B139|nr:hypothetical protein [Kribbella catacumbae]